MAEDPKEPTITEAYTAKLQEVNANMQHDITRAFQEHRETWNNIMTYEQARWRWATEEQRDGPDTSFVGHGFHAVPKAPGTALETSQAVQAAIQETAVAREAREAWLLEEGGTTRQQVIHRDAYDRQHPALDARQLAEPEMLPGEGHGPSSQQGERPDERTREALQQALWENAEAREQAAGQEATALLAERMELQSALAKIEAQGVARDSAEVNRGEGHDAEEDYQRHVDRTEGQQDPTRAAYPIDQGEEWTPAQRQQYREAWTAQQQHFKAQELLTASQGVPEQEATEARSAGERLLAYYTDLKAHLREQEQLGLLLDASERRQEVLAFAEHWQAQHGRMQSADREAQREYVAVQAHVAERREAREQTPTRAQEHETGMELA